MNIIVSSINFHPDHAGIGVYSTDFPTYLAEQGDKVVMVTGFPYYPRWKKNKEDQRRFFAEEVHEGILVKRGYLYVPEGKFGAMKRLCHELSFCFFAMINLLRSRKPDVIVVFTPPFFLAIVGLLAKWYWRIPLVVNIQDLPIDAARSLGMVKDGILIRLLHRIESWAYRQADLVCSISPKMIQNIKNKGVKDDRLCLVPNWIDLEKRHSQGHSGKFRSLFPGTDGKFLIAYAGNIGVKQGIDVLVRAAKELEPFGKFHVFIIGDGADKTRLMELASSLAITNLTFLPFMDSVRYEQMLADVDAAFVAQRSGAGDNFFPSKLLGLMANAKPLLVATDQGSELASVVCASECGLVSDYDDVNGIVVNALRMQTMNGDELHEIGEKGRAVVQQFDRAVVLQRWRDQIRSLVSSENSSSITASIDAVAKQDADLQDVTN